MSYSAASDAAAAAAADAWNDEPKAAPASTAPVSEHPLMKNNFERIPHVFEENGVTYKAGPEDIFRLATLRTIEWRIEMAEPAIVALANKIGRMNSLIETCIVTITNANQRINELEKQVQTLTGEKNAATATATAADVPETI